MDSVFYILLLLLLLLINVMLTFLYLRHVLPHLLLLIAMRLIMILQSISVLAIIVVLVIIVPTDYMLIIWLIPLFVIMNHILREVTKRFESSANVNYIKLYSL